MIIPWLKPEAQDADYQNYKFFGQEWEAVHHGMNKDEVYVEITLRIGMFPFSNLDVQIYMRHNKDLENEIIRIGSLGKNVKKLEGYTQLFKDVGMYDTMNERVTEVIQSLFDMMKDCKCPQDAQKALRYYDENNPVVFLYEL